MLSVNVVALNYCAYSLIAAETDGPENVKNAVDSAQASIAKEPRGV